MRSRLAIVVIVLGVIATGAFRGLVSAPSVEAQGVTTQLFKAVLDEHLRIADVAMVELYQKYR